MLPTSLFKFLNQFIFAAIIFTFCQIWLIEKWYHIDFLKSILNFFWC